MASFPRLGWVKVYEGGGSLFVRMWLDSRRPALLLMSDGRYQSRPIKAAKEDAKRTGAGMAELIGPEEVKKLAAARADQLRPMTSRSLLITDRDELRKARSRGRPASAVQHARLGREGPRPPGKRFALVGGGRVRRGGTAWPEPRAPLSLVSDGVAFPSAAPKHTP